MRTAPQKKILNKLDLLDPTKVLSASASLTEPTPGQREARRAMIDPNTLNPGMRSSYWRLTQVNVKALNHEFMCRPSAEVWD